MTTEQREAAEDTLRAYIGQLDYAALTRIVNGEQWCIGAYLAPEGSRCLLGHAQDWYWAPYAVAGHPQVALAKHPEADTEGECRVARAFDELCEAQGIDRTAAACILLAATLLHDRETAALRALLGEEVTA